jgi:uncharacterized UPF0160 family protein
MKIFKFKKAKKLVTHNGSFHADDIFATASLLLMLEKNGERSKIFRTRDEKIIKSGDFVYDVGGFYDADKNVFDHHQIGGAGKRGDSNIEYSSFGLVWKKFGAEICDSKEVADILEKKLVMPVDANDNGMDLFDLKTEVSPYTIYLFFMSFKPTWKDVSEQKLLENFKKAVKTAKELLKREIKSTQDYVEGEKAIKSCYENAEDKRLIIFDKKYQWENIMSNYLEPQIVVFPRFADGVWGAEGVFVGLPSFERRKYFPKNWAGLRDEELQKVTGVSGAVFCHRNLFMVVARSKEGAVKLAKLALENKEN